MLNQLSAIAQQTSKEYIIPISPFHHPRQALIISTDQIAPLFLGNYRLVGREHIRKEYIGPLLVEPKQPFLAEREYAAEN